MNASDHRARARAALKGNWLWAVLTTLVATLLGGISGSGGGSSSGGSSSGGVNFEVNLPVNMEPAPVGNAAAMGTGAALKEMMGNIPDGFWWIIGVVFFVIAVVAILVSLIIGGPVGLGYRQYTLNLMDGKPAEIGQLFSKFKQMGVAIRYRLLVMAVTGLPMIAVGILGYLLILLLMPVGLEGLAGLATVVLMIGAVIAVTMISYGVVLGEYILVEDPSCTARQAMRSSWDLMNGNKWRYFCLGFSFFGWALLCAFTLGIGNLFLNPYVQVAYASLYRELCPPPAPNNPYHPVPPVTP